MMFRALDMGLPIEQDAPERNMGRSGDVEGHME
jgi:hypothetical protein